LIGYRATGKTTVGCLLAERLGWTCVDTDDHIQREVGKSVRQIFEQEGEASFRDYETAAIGSLARGHKLVLTVGGGAVLRAENRRAIATAGPVVWLDASVATIHQRLIADTQTALQRPALTDLSQRDEIERLVGERQPIYAACADVRIDTDGLTPRQVTDAILARLDLSEKTAR
jgi:shikimate kinase